MPKQLMVEKIDGYCQHIWRDNLIDIIPPTFQNGHDYCTLKMKYGGDILLSPETPILGLFNFLNHQEEYKWEKFW